MMDKVLYYPHVIRHALARILVAVFPAVGLPGFRVSIRIQGRREGFLCLDHLPRVIMLSVWDLGRLPLCFSSSGSSEDNQIAHDPVQFLACRSYIDTRGQGETRSNMGSRSPGPRSRGPTSPTSPLHHRLSGVSLDSPTGKKDDGKSMCHKLPLPPGSPTSPSALSSTRTCGMSENSSCNLSKWRKGRLLGRGTFGHVYLGFNSESGQMCAIKEVRFVSDDQTSKECLKQLNQEINLLSQLSHPNIVRYYGSDLGEETLSVYLEYVSGGSIHKLLQEYGAFKEPVIQNYTRQILSGLAYLHGRNTVHRDIKGANILVDPNGEIKLADFGMANMYAT
ncbi:DNA repair metallo-beta-lactamase family protein, putative isoform 1 [Hibiscus syriacus]|uniref:mitogen-activated protein kinase kinase kinase n=1 Tax=Hibiscus syriacus TaxID=106335 RepID=A0A6A2WRI7_HIBSY|nr:DNA repair metallo-beta-lactamase family protein, putative isoform 1 [Hibiscus syriacus]